MWDKTLNTVIVINNFKRLRVNPNEPLFDIILRAKTQKMKNLGGIM